MNLSKLARAVFFISTSALVFPALSHASPIEDEALSDVVKAGQQINQSANKSQGRVDAISEKIKTKLQQFKTVNKEVDGLNVYNQQMNTQIDNQREEITQLAISMEQVSIVERQISPLMARMISTLETFVALDVPFLTEERSQRIQALKAMMERADIAISEKFRRVLEAYQVEVDYGRTIEAYSGLLNIDSSERNVDFLRVGRVSLVYQTRDGQKLGVWNNETKSWQELPAEYRLDINKGLRIARKQLAPDLIIVPIAQKSAE
jgi:hypothetical protein